MEVEIPYLLRLGAKVRFRDRLKNLQFRKSGFEFALYFSCEDWELLLHQRGRAK